MKIVKKDLKHGILKIKIDNPDDAWNLESILEKGDFISGKSFRSGEILRGDQKEKTKKKPVFLKILLEKKEFHEYTGKLRLTGKVVEGPEDIISSYHTLEAEEGKILTIEKNWKKWQLEKINRCLNEQPKILLCVIDEREANLAEIKERMKTISDVYNKKAGKEHGSDYKEFFREVFSILKSKSDVDNIVVAGPGFAKEEFLKEVKKEDPELAKKIILESCSHTGSVGISEVIKRGVLERVSRDSRISEETRIVEDFFGELSKDGLVTYGKKEIEKALNMGAVEKLIITEGLVRENEELLKKAEKIRAEIHIISEEHESGKRLKNLGGIAAFLRFKVD